LTRQRNQNASLTHSDAGKSLFHYTFGTRFQSAYGEMLRQHYQSAAPGTYCITIDNDFKMKIGCPNIALPHTHLHVFHLDSFILLVKLFVLTSTPRIEGAIRYHWQHDQSD
jgi:hypothetical protein